MPTFATKSLSIGLDKRRKANSLFVRAFCSSCYGQPEAGSLSGTVTTELAGTERARARVMTTLRVELDGSGPGQDPTVQVTSPTNLPFGYHVTTHASCRYNSPTFLREAVTTVLQSGKTPEILRFFNAISD
jgi:hypothetical protein